MSDPSRDERFQDILVAWLEAAEAGQTPDREEWLARHAEFANELREFFAADEDIERIAAPLRGEATAANAINAPTLALAANDSTHAPSSNGDGSAILNPQSALGKVRYFGDYELLDEVARGGMGVVYRARQSGLSRIVALKMILAGRLAGADEVKRFRAEAEAAASLDHPHIVPVFEVGEHEGQHYFSMGFVEGESLADRLHDGPLSPQVAASVALQIAEAVAYAHGKGVIHRDLKPANVLLSNAECGLRNAECEENERDPQFSEFRDPHSAFPVAKLTDFGLAKRVEADRGLTTTGQILGTPSYMPPEQASGRVDQVKEAADLYSIGAILYAMLTGRPPFQADNPVDTLVQVMEQEPAPPRQLNPKVPRDLETICLKCLEKEPHRRYLTATALAEDLSRFLNDEPIRARPLGGPEKAWRWLRKQGRSVALAAGATAATIVVALLGAAIWYVYSQWRLGYLSLDTDRPPLVAEILNDAGERVTESRTLPTAEPIALPAGEYAMHVTGEARFSQAYRVNVPRSGETRLEFNLEDQTLFPTLEIERAYDLVPLDGRTELVLLTKEGVSLRNDGQAMRSGATAQDVWKTTLAGSTDGAIQGVKGFRWPWTPENDSNDQYSGYDKFDRRPQFVGSRRDVLPCVWEERSPEARRMSEGDVALAPRSRFGLPGEAAPFDLDGDGADDLVLAARHQAWLLALNGKTGQPLWLAARGAELRGESDPQVMQYSGMVQAAVLGAPQVAGDLNSDGAPDMIATFFERKAAQSYPSTAQVGAARWVEAVSGKSGETLWRYDLPESGFQMGAGSEPNYAFQFFTYATGYGSSGGSGYVSGRESIRSLSNRGSFKRSGEFVYAPDPARLISTADPGAPPHAIVMAGSQLVVLDVKTGQPVSPPLETGRHPIRSLSLADVTGDGAPEALVLSQNQPAQPNTANGNPPLLATYGLSPLAKLWERVETADYWDSPPPPLSRAPWPVSADLDGDGAAELLAACETPRPTANYYMDQAPAGALEAIDGRTGKRRWMQKLRTMDEQLDWFAVGPDVNGDGTREIYVATLLYAETELFVDCLSGADGAKLWWTRRPLGDRSGDSYWITAVTWWDAGPDGWPQLAVHLQPADHTELSSAVYLYSSRDGALNRFAKDVGDLHLADADGDGRDELYSYRPWLGRDRGGRLDAHRNTSEIWRRLGGDDWHASGDFDDDGAADMVYVEGGRSLGAVSGLTGRSLWRQRMPDLYSNIALTPLGLEGDLNGDGSPDVFVAPDTNSARSQPWTPFHAFSGRDGKQLWRADVEINSLAGQPLLSEARDIDGDGQPELVLIARMDWGWNLQNSFGSAIGNLWLAVLSGRTGAVVWKTPLDGAAADGSLTLNTNVYMRQMIAGEIRVAYGDLNGDGALDLLLPAEIPGQVKKYETRAVSGKDGERLWSRPLPVISGADAAELHVTAPAIADLDGDGRQEAVILEFSNASPPSPWEGVATVRALDGATGETKWSWSGPRYVQFQQPWEALRLLRRPALHILQVAGRKEPIIAVNFWGNFGQAIPDEGPLDDSIKINAVVAVFDHAGQVLSRLPVRDGGDFAVWRLDADGDGSDELAIAGRHELMVIRPGAKNETLWRHAYDHDYNDEIAGIAPATADRPATILARRHGGLLAVNAATGDLLWESLPPSARLGRTTYTVEPIPLLSNLTRRPNDRPWPAIRETKTSPANESLVAYRYGAVTFAERPKPVGKNSVREAWQPLAARPDVSDPRLVRLLPWMRNTGLGNGGEALMIVQGVAIMMLFGAVLVFAPGAYLVNLIRGRTWSLRAFLLAPVFVGVMLVVLAMPLPERLWGTLPWWGRITRGLVILPALLLIYAALQGLRRRKWAKLLAWTLATMLAMAVASAIMIAIDRLRTPDELPYSWEGWYWMWFWGAYFTGWLLIPVAAVEAIGRQMGQRGQARRVTAR